MSDAYKCDRCGEFEPGRRAALYITIEEMARRTSGGVIFGSGAEAPWSWEETDAEFCSECAAELVEHIDDYLTGANVDE